MRFFAFFVILTATYAAPQGGYNYKIQIDPTLNNELSSEQYQLLQQFAHQQINDGGHSQQPLILEPSNQNIQQQQFREPIVQVPVQPVIAQNVPQPIIQTIAQPIIVPNVQQAPAIRHQTIQPIAQPQQYQHQQARQEQHERPQFNKEFFYISAPQESYEPSQDLEKHLEKLRKNIRVVFIRAPEHNGATDAAVQLAKQSLQQQTVVYVLTKTPDISELAHKLQQERNTVHSKPDVVFIKYKTPHEAEQAQRTIQAQYEQLDGPSHHHHHNIAKTQDYVGSTENHHASNSVSIDPRKTSSNVEAEAPSQEYLPAVKKV